MFADLFDRERIIDEAYALVSALGTASMR